MSYDEKERIEFIDEGLKKYCDAKFTVKSFEKEIYGLLNDIISNYNNWRSFKPDFENINQYWGLKATSNKIGIAIFTNTEDGSKGTLKTADYIEIGIDWDMDPCKIYVNAKINGVGLPLITDSISSADSLEKNFINLLEKISL